MSDDTIIIKAPAGTKARWVRESQAQGLKLTDWITRNLEARTTNVYKIQEALAQQASQKAEAQQAAPSQDQS